MKTGPQIQIRRKSLQKIQKNKKTFKFWLYLNSALSNVHDVIYGRPLKKIDLKSFFNLSLLVISKLCFIILHFFSLTISQNLTNWLDLRNYFEFKCNGLFQRNINFRFQQLYTMTWHIQFNKSIIASVCNV